MQAGTPKRWDQSSHPAIHLKLTTVQYGLIGSTEWGEDFAEFIDKYVVAYVNIGRSVDISHVHGR